MRLNGNETRFRTVVAECDSRIQRWVIARDGIAISYLFNLETEIHLFDLEGRWVTQLALDEWETLRLTSGSVSEEEFFLERESFTLPVEIWRCAHRRPKPALWWRPRIDFDRRKFCQRRVWFRAKDGIDIPMFLTARENVFDSGPQPVIMTAYGGHGVGVTPQFSVLAALLMELGCIFALPNIRGGSEFGQRWHEAARRSKRQVARNDFLNAAEWLLSSGTAQAGKLAIFGGSNSGLLVASAAVERPDLFCAVLCIAPLVDMLRYHLFDGAGIWRDEFGTADNRSDFPALLAYSPYHRVRNNTRYPATMIVSGDADQSCNPLHARKMVARLQGANASDRPVLLDYSSRRGHVSTLSLTERIQSVADRVAFLCHCLGLEA